MELTPIPYYCVKCTTTIPINASPTKAITTYPWCRPWLPTATDRYPVHPYYFITNFFKMLSAYKEELQAFLQTIQHGSEGNLYALYLARGDVLFSWLGKTSNAKRLRHKH